MSLPRNFAVATVLSFTFYWTVALSVYSIVLCAWNQSLTTAWNGNWPRVYISSFHRKEKCSGLHCADIVLRSCAMTYEVFMILLDFHKGAQTTHNSAPVHRPVLSSFHSDLDFQVQSFLFIDQLYHFTRLVLIQTTKHPLSARGIDSTKMHFCICSSQ